RLIDDLGDLRVALGGDEALKLRGGFLAMAQLDVDLAERVEQLGPGRERVRRLELDAGLVVAPFLVRLGRLRDVSLGLAAVVGERSRRCEDEQGERPRESLRRRYRHDLAQLRAA